MPELDTESQDCTGCCATSPSRPNFTARGRRRGLQCLQHSLSSASYDEHAKPARGDPHPQESRTLARGSNRERALRKRPRVAAQAPHSAAHGETLPVAQHSAQVGRYQAKASVRKTDGWPPLDVSMASSGSFPQNLTFVTSLITCGNQPLLNSNSLQATKLRSATGQTAAPTCMNCSDTPEQPCEYTSTHSKRALQPSLSQARDAACSRCGKPAEQRVSGHLASLHYCLLYRTLHVPACRAMQRRISTRQHAPSQPQAPRASLQSTGGHTCCCGSATNAFPGPRMVFPLAYSGCLADTPPASVPACSS